MSVRYTTKTQKGVAAAALAVALTVTAAGCGGDSEKNDTASSSSASSDNGGEQADTAAGGEADPNAKLAVLKGAGGVEYTINAVTRDSGGFVTVSGQLKNTGGKTFYNTDAWRGTEEEIKGGSVSGGTLVDQKGKKRYYVLRDTEGRCLCTSGVSQIEAGQSVPVFMQFPAPPEGTAEVDFSIPTFNTVPIKISE